MKEEELMLMHVLDCGRTDLYKKPSVLTEEQNRVLNEMKERRRAGEPLQYILGETDFMGLKMSVNPHVLIPRPETEILVDEALKRIPSDAEVLELGGGSGNIAVALAKYKPQIKLVSVDISSGAIKVAKNNAQQHAVSDRVEFVHEDMVVFLKQCASQAKMFDVVISNPPYIPTRRLDFLPVDVQREPRAALDGGEDGIFFYQKIIPLASSVLREQGWLFLEIGDDQEQAVTALCHKEFSQAESVDDYTNTKRVIIARK